MKKVFYFSVILVLALALFSALLVLNRTTKTMSKAQEQAALAKMLGRKPNLDLKDAPTGNVQYKGKYGAFMYPAMAKIYTYRDPSVVANKAELEIFSFDIADPRLIFYFDVNNNPGNLTNIDDIAAVKLREDKTRGYQQSEILADGQRGLIFTRIDLQSEKSGFFIVNSKIYSISVTGNDSKEVENLFDNIIKTLQFLK
jgi:hypothetical protein